MIPRYFNICLRDAFEGILLKDNLGEQISFQLEEENVKNIVFFLKKNFLKEHRNFLDSLFQFSSCR